MNRSYLGALVFLILGLIVALIKPFADLPPMGHLILGTVIIALGLWIFKPGNVPLIAGGSVIIFGGLAILHAFRETLVNPVSGNIYSSGELFSVICNGFVSSAVWTLIPALYFGFVLQKTGLGKRVAYLVLKSFKPSWVTMTISWLLIGVALSALTPSITVRVAIVMPIAISIVEACKLEFRSKGAAFVTLIAWGMCLFPGTGWLTGSLSGPIMQGFLPMEVKAMANFSEWFQILALPWFTVTILFVVLAFFLAKPNQPIGIAADTFKEEYKKLGGITRDELITLLVLVGSLIMFSTETFHGIPTAATAMGAMFLLVIFRIIAAPEISTGINWDVVMFFGVTVGLSQLFRFSGISAWVEPIITPAILGLAGGSPLIFMLIITIGLMAVRFIDVPWGFTTIALTSVVTIPLFFEFGYHPLVITMAYVAAINFFLLGYQQPWILMAEGMIQGRGWAPNHIPLFGAIYIVSVLVAIVVAVPYWKLIGVIP